MPKRSRRKPLLVLPSEPTFEAHPDHVTAVIWLPKDMPPGLASVGLHFISVDHIMAFMNELVETAAKVWPDDPLIREMLDTK